MKAGSKRPKPTLVIAVIALIVALTGTAYAALGKNSVGSRQLKSQAVASSKFANDSISTDKVSRKTIDGENIDLSKLGTVPNATRADHASNATTLNGHPASCPDGTKLIRGLCFDSSPNGPVLGVKAASDGCSAKSGRLPSIEQLDAARTAIDLGDGTGTHAQFADSYFFDNFNPWTTVVSSSGPKPVQNENAKTKELLASYQYICVYPLVR